MGLRRSTDATSEPITRAEAKLFMRVGDDGNDAHEDDTYIDNLISAARNWCERFTRRAFINQTWVLTRDSFPSAFRLPKPPLSSVTSIQYVDTGGTTQTEATAVYTVITDREPGEVVQAYEQNWSSTRDIENAVTVTYVAGYGAAGSNVPTGIRQAILLMVKHWYDMREPVITGMTTSEVPMSAESLLWSYRVQDWRSFDGR
jgi:uncharacterized phiE125 gp8 family phage protein